MAETMIGTPSGVTAVGSVNGGKLAEILADSANGFIPVAADLANFYVGQVIIFRVKSTGAVFGTTARNVTSIAALGVVYDGADVTLVPGTHGVYDASLGVGVTSSGTDTRSNINGGPSADNAFAPANLNSIESMKTALGVQDATTFTAERLRRMTYNDLVYAVRVRLYPTSIK